MGIIYLAEAFFPVPGKDPRGPGGRVSVPAPVDPDTPAEPWWFDRIASRCARFREVGFTHIMLPPVSKDESGSLPTGTGYGLFDHYDLGSKNQQGSIATRFGSREQLQRLVAIARADGLEVWGNLVLHQMAGGKAGVYIYKGADGKTLNGRFPKEQGCFRSGGPTQTVPPWSPEDPVPDAPDDFNFGDELVYANCDPPRYTIEGVEAWTDWLIGSVGFDGFRVDDAKGLNVPSLMEILNSGAINGLPGFFEYFDGNPGTLSWYRWQQMHGRMSVLDFTCHWAIKGALDYGAGMWALQPSRIYAGQDPFGSVQFVDNPDTDNSPGQQVINSKRLGYFYILCISEGLPMVYHRDYSTDVGCYGLQPYIDNLVWCHEHLIGGNSAERHIEHDVQIVERLGHQVGKPGALSAWSLDPINHRQVWVETSFGPNVHLHDYTGNGDDIWTNQDGWVEVTIPSNYFGSGNSYVCYAPAGVQDGGRPGLRTTTQTFFGAADLDIDPALDGTVVVCRIWCAKDTPISGDLRLTLPTAGAASVSLQISGAGGLFYESLSGPAGLTFPSSSGDQFLVVEDGWVTIDLVSGGLLPPDGGVPFELEITYTGTKDLHA